MITFNNKDFLINGVTNGIGASGGEQFLYHNVLEKLQVHGIADNEKVPGVRYRRSFLNKTGRAFVAELERRALRAKANEGASPTRAADAAQSTSPPGGT